MTSTEETKALAPWIDVLPPDWLATRLDAVADVLFSNVDKHTKEGEVPVRLCNYVDVYKNEQITSALDFMEASADPRELRSSRFSAVMSSRQKIQRRLTTLPFQRW